MVVRTNAWHDSYLRHEWEWEQKSAEKADRIGWERNGAVFPIQYTTQTDANLFRSALRRRALAAGNLRVERSHSNT